MWRTAGGWSSGLLYGWLGIIIRVKGAEVRDWWRYEWEGAAGYA
jgi:hypothetical protein